ncbi:hypothetical protein [Armatimonas sp.]|uniref:hypothetical protein n=1 Tax=Armatimonas sp. TaxID=1872638 RepID=UPI003751EDEE
MSAVTAIPDLWPTTIQPHSNQVTPKAILQSQAKYLEQRTEGLIIGEVIVRTIGQRLVHDFYLRSPRLDDYRFLMFTVIQLRHELYPVGITEEVTLYPENPAEQEEYMKKKLFGEECKDEESFKERLRQLFLLERSVRIIDSLVAQSASAE